MSANYILNQINRLTTDIISSGLCDAQNFPILKEYHHGIKEVTINTKTNSLCLKNITYNEMYVSLLENNTYNLKMIDGALITFLYRFQNNELISHLLSFFPSPNLEMFQNEPELYLQDELYLECYDNKRIVNVPLRFDFDIGDSFIPIEHPKSHLTLGQYKNCRIPVTSALSPYQFLDFIIRHFYHPAYAKGICKLTKYNYNFGNVLDKKEKEMIYIHIP